MAGKLTPPVPASVARFVDNPIAGWPNDDLLLTVEAQAFFAEHHAPALPIFDWPELRARFAAFDAVANSARRNSRKGGIQAAIVGFASLVVAALTPVLTFGALDYFASRTLGVLAVMLAVAATLWGYFQLLVGRRKSEWLTNRFWTERLRQLHFQFIINNLDLAAEVMRDPAKRADWDERRATVLDEFEMRNVRSVTATYKRMRDDVAEEEFWLNDAWQSCPALPPPSIELDKILMLIDKQRFEVQRRFTDLKSADGAFSSITRSATVRTASDVLTLVTLFLTIIGGALLASGVPVDGSQSLPSKFIAAALALASATVVLLRVLNEGLQLSSEAERYGWYNAAVTALQSRYGHAQTAGKVDLLRDMERLTYQEMRWFLNAFQDARFVI